MERKTKTKILVIFLVLILGIITWFFVFLGSQQQTQVVDQVKGISPFGFIQNNTGEDGVPGDLNNRGNTGSNDEETPPPTPVEPEPTPTPLLPRLQRITDFPTGGFIPLITITQEEVSDITIDENGQTIETTQEIDVENHSVRYASILDGTVFESFINNTSLSQEKIVENYIPNSQQVFFSGGGNHVSFQYWNNEDRTPESYIAEIKKRTLEISDCPFTISRGLKIGDSHDDITDLHQFLNRVPQTRVAEIGINSPGNEGSVMTEATVTAIKNFQTLHQLDIDGVLGRGTKSVMETVCNEQQTDLAQEAFDANPEKYDIDGSFINQGIEQFAFAPESERLFYIQPTTTGVEGVVRDLDTEISRVIFSSPYAEWLIEWNNEKEIIITTKPSYQAIGYSYSLNPETGNFYKIIEGRGLTTRGNYDGSYLFGSRIVNNNVDSFIVNRATGETSTLLAQTFSEKCAWGRSNDMLYCFVPNNLGYQNEYPDIWYQGIEAMEDTLWEIEVLSLDERLLSDIVIEYNNELDINNVLIDAEGDYIYFTNKTNEDLWSYRIN